MQNMTSVLCGVLFNMLCHITNITFLLELSLEIEGLVAGRLLKNQTTLLHVMSFVY